MKRRPYAERTAVTVHDLLDQPDSKYIAVVHDLLGQKSYIACDGIIINEHVVTLTRVEQSSGKLADREKEKPVPVAAFPTRSGWALLLRDRFIMMNGSDWEKAQVEDGQNFKETRKAAVNSEIVEAIALPNGNVVAIPASPEALKEYEESLKQQKSGPQAAPHAGPHTYI